VDRWYLAKLFPWWYYEFPTFLLYLNIVCKCSWWCCHLIILCIVENSNNNLFQVNFFINYSYSFVMLHSHFLWLFYNSIYFGQDCKYGLGWTIPCCCSSTIIFANLWHHGNLATPNIVTSFINDLFQVPLVILLSLWSCNVVLKKCSL
jgi:hypothetical protein